ncbi:MAG TPA: hypothetical protein PKB13_12085 [Clostridia bacterium]|nr:hypothetical protein [Clostridia bacterium]
MMAEVFLHGLYIVARLNGGHGIGVEQIMETRVRTARRGDELCCVEAHPHQRHRGGCNPP